MCCPSSISYNLLQKSSSKFSLIQKIYHNSLYPLCPRSHTQYLHQLFTQDLQGSCQDLQNLVMQSYQLIFMHEGSLKPVLEDLETFVELKQQQFLILAWIQFKKNAKPTFGGKRILGPHLELRQNANNTVSYSNNFCRMDGLPESNESGSQKGYKSRERLITEFEDMRERHDEMLQTFNPGNSGQGFRSQAKDDRYRSSSRNLPSFKECDIQDDDQFEDIVLDRLSKLQENINEMMREKRLKEDLRGYVGAPIQQPKSSDDFQSDLQQHARAKCKYKEQSDSEKSQKYQAKGRYQSWQTSPIKNKQQDKGFHNLKYIPLQKHSPVNINKIKSILERSHQDEEESILDNPQYFPSKYVRERKQGYLYTDTRTKEGRKYQNIHDPIIGREESSSKNALSSLYFNRYGVSQTARNSQIHYLPKNIEMKTVIESKARYSRANNTKVALNTTADGQAVPRFSYKPRKSGASDSSANSYLSMPSWRVNASALY